MCYVLKILLTKNKHDLCLKNWWQWKHVCVLRCWPVLHVLWEILPKDGILRLTTAMLEQVTPMVWTTSGRKDRRKMKFPKGHQGKEPACIYCLRYAKYVHQEPDSFRLSLSRIESLFWSFLSWWRVESQHICNTVKCSKENPWHQCLYCQQKIVQRLWVQLFTCQQMTQV